MLTGRFVAARALVLLSLAGCIALPAPAQYKVVGPDGRVTYTDRAPSDPALRVTPLGSTGIAASPPAGTLPLALRQAAERYPVTLYSAADCAPCDAGRQLLLQRGVPFTEKLIVIDADAQSLERIFGARTVPALSIGAQALRGLSPTEWNAYLDAAGYPRESRLPRNWEPPTPTPLAARAPAQASAPPAPAPEVPEAAPQPPEPPRPGALRF